MGACLVFIVFAGPFLLWFCLAFADMLGTNIFYGTFTFFLIPVAIILVVLLIYKILDIGEKAIPSNLFAEYKIAGTQEKNNYYIEKNYNIDKHNKIECKLGELVFLVPKKTELNTNFCIYDMSSAFHKKHKCELSKIVGVRIYKNGTIADSLKTKNINNVKLVPRMEKVDNCICFCVKNGIQYLYVIPFYENEYENALFVYNTIKTNIIN